MSTFKATLARNEQEFTVEVEGESQETVAEYLDNCGEYDDCVLLSVEEIED